MLVEVFRQPEHPVEEKRADLDGGLPHPPLEQPGDFSMMSTRSAGFFFKITVAVDAPEIAPPMIATSYKSFAGGSGCSGGSCRIMLPL